MSDIGQAIDWWRPNLTSASSAAIGNETTVMSASFLTAQAWSTANSAIFIPFRIAYPMTFSSMYWINGTVGTDSCDVGVYTASGSRIVSSGGTLTSGASVPQIVSVTSTTLQPGLYYLAMARNGTTNTLGAASLSLQQTRSVAIYMTATSYPLPSSVTYVATSSAISVPLVGISTTGVI